MNGIAWSRIVGAAACRAVLMPGELAGYLALGVLEAMDAPGRVVAEDIQLTDSGRLVLLRVLPSAAEASEFCLRGLLRQILDVSSVPSPALLRVASVQSGNSEVSFAKQLQTALIPVNRAAARRALARLHRELMRAPAAAFASLQANQPMGQTAPEEMARSVEDEVSRPAPQTEELALKVPIVELAEAYHSFDLAAASDLPCVLDAERLLVEIPDLIPIVGGMVPSHHGAVEPEMSEEDACPAAVEPLCETSPLVAAITANTADAHGETRLIPAVACEGARTANFAAIDDAFDARRASQEVRETTLVLAPVALAPRSEQTLRLQIAAKLTPCKVDTSPAAVQSCEICVTEPSVALPLVTMKRPVRTVTALANVESVEQLQVATRSEPNVTAADAVSRHETAAAQCQGFDFVYVDVALVESIDLRELENYSPNIHPSEFEATAAIVGWDATCMDEVVEVDDNEIIYEQLLDEGLDEAIAAEGDYLGNDLFEAVVPRAVVLAQPIAGSGLTVALEVEDLNTGSGHYLPVSRTHHATGVLCDDAAFDVDDSELLVVDGECEPACAGPPSARRSADGVIGLLSGERPELATLYRKHEQRCTATQSTVEGLSSQFGGDSLWSQNELCQNLRFVAGMEVSLNVVSEQTHTPPPSVETIRHQHPEQLEPTRRLRRVGSMAALVLALGAGAWSVRAAEGKVSPAAQLSVDALGQICRATVTVTGEVARPQLRIRQVGDAQFRSPTTLSREMASFAGLRCSQDAELFVEDAATARLRRIPIAAEKLSPRDTHRSANVAFRLDESVTGG